ncbi:hypothetical protein ACIQJT_32995 [Streptomyces sp. NPDC091972]|uniref:hypothetical protein n=1 Tax=Streptomyces sp. NPDC091972 TaxID=3366007 RepID=UPI0037FF8774
MGNREESQDEEQPKRGLQRIPWVNIATMITVIIGIGSLAFTGIATYYGAEVSKDQLDQSREDADRETRNQAMRVTYWVDAASKHPGVHLMNRSPDPVSRVSLAFTASLSAEQGLVFPIWLSELPPCSELVIYKESMRYQDRVSWDRARWYSPVAADVGGPKFMSSQKLPASALITGVSFVSFADRDGQDWKRESGVLSMDEPSAVGGFTAKASPKNWLGHVTQIDMKSAPLCGDSTG